MPRIIFVTTLLVAFLIAPASAQSPTPSYVVLGDSIEFGLGDDIAADGLGYVPLVTRPQALAAAAGHAPIVVSWGGGGNDLAAQ